MKKNCEHCGIEYKTDKSTKRFCGLKCGYLGRSMPMKKSRDWLACSVCMRRAGLSHKSAAKLLPIVSAPTIYTTWRDAGVFQDIKVDTVKVAIKAEKATIRRNAINAEREERAKMRGPKKTKEEKARLQKEYQLARYYANHEENKIYCAEASRRRYKKLFRVDHAFTCKQVLKRSVKRLVRYTGARKKESSVTYLGCSMLEARAHIERQFVRGMSWSNYGTAWEIDHIMPLAAFDLTNKDHVAQAGHYTNLRPLWKYANRAKGDKIEPHQASLLI